MGAQTFNRYNLFYRLERHLLLHERGAVTKKDDPNAPASEEAKKFETLELPPLPSRYAHLDIPKMWFLSSKGSDKKRSHRKSHGVASFTEIARVVASNWKSIDQETMNFVTVVSNTLKAHVNEHGISTAGNSSARPKKKKTKKKKNGGGESCLDSSSESILDGSNKEGGGEFNVSPVPPPQGVPNVPMQEVRHKDSGFGSLITDRSFMPFKTPDDLHGDPFMPFKTPEPFLGGGGNHGHGGAVPMILDDSNRVTLDDSNRSGASAMSTLSTSSRAPVFPSQAFSEGSVDLVSSMEQSFIRDVLGAGAPSIIADGVGSDGQPQTITNLLAVMNSNSRGRRKNKHPRSSSMPGNMPSAVPSSDTELDHSGAQVIQHQQPRQAYRRSSSMSMSSQQTGTSCHMVPSSEAELGNSHHRRQPRRASSINLGSNHGPLIQESDLVPNRPNCHSVPPPDGHHHRSRRGSDVTVGSVASSSSRQQRPQQQPPQQQMQGQGRLQPPSSANKSQSQQAGIGPVNELDIQDDEIFQMWMEHQNQQNSPGMMGHGQVMHHGHGGHGHGRGHGHPHHRQGP